MTVNAAGQLVFEKRPDEELRFFSLQLLPGQAGMQYMSKAELEAYVDTIVRQGYNMVRIHGPGRFLVGPNRGAVLKNQERFELPQTPDELEFDPEIQDRFDYFIYLLKKNGVYVNLDGLGLLRRIFQRPQSVDCAAPSEQLEGADVRQSGPAAELGRRRVEDPDSCESVHENRSAG